MGRAFLFSILLASGCGAEDPTNVAVTVCGDLEVPDDLDMLRFSVVDPEEGELWYGLSILDGLEGPISFTGSVPALEEGQWVRVQGLHDGVVRLGSDARGADPLAVALDESCLGVQCPLGQTCTDGECSIITGEPQCP